MSIFIFFNTLIAIFAQFYLVAFEEVAKKTVSKYYLHAAIIISLACGILLYLDYHPITKWAFMIANFVLYGWILMLTISFSSAKKSVIRHHSNVLVALTYGFSSSVLMWKVNPEFMKYLYSNTFVLKRFATPQFIDQKYAFYTDNFMFIIAIIMIVATYFYLVYFTRKIKQEYFLKTKAAK